MAEAYIYVNVLLLATLLAISYTSVVGASEVFVASGSVAVLPCVISSSNKYSTAVIWKRIIEGKESTVWRRDKSGLEFRPVGQAPQAHCPKSNFGNSKFNLHIEQTKEEDAGMYKCEVEGYFKYVMLHVIKVSVSPAEVLEGDRLMLSCTVTPRPAHMLLRWELNGSPVTSHINTYTVNKVSQKDAGTWSCLIRSKQTEAKASMQVQVEGILIPKDNLEVVYAQLGSSVTLPCIFSSKLLFTSFSWNRVSKSSNLPAALHLSFNISSIPGVYSPSSSTLVERTAYIESVQYGDEGTYRCSGEVQGGNGKHVKVERNIQLVTAQVLRSSRNGKTTLTCQSSSTSYVTSYEWVFVKYNGNNTQTFISVQNSTSNVLSIPKETHLGEWVCRFYNKQQILGNASYHLQMMGGLEGQQKFTSTNKVAMIIGLSLLVLLLVLIALQLYRNHRRRKMIFQYPAMETIVHLAANERELKARIREREKIKKGADGENQDIQV